MFTVGTFRVADETKSSCELENKENESENAKDMPPSPQIKDLLPDSSSTDHVAIADADPEPPSMHKTTDSSGVEPTGDVAMCNGLDSESQDRDREMNTNGDGGDVGEDVGPLPTTPPAECPKLPDKPERESSPMETQVDRRVREESSSTERMDQDGDQKSVGSSSLGKLAFHKSSIQ